MMHGGTYIVVGAAVSLLEIVPLQAFADGSEQEIYLYLGKGYCPPDFLYLEGIDCSNYIDPVPACLGSCWWIVA